jgi:copper chaperone
MQERQIAIEGMTCHHCVMAVRKALSQVPGLTVKDVEIGSALVIGVDTEPQRQQIRKAIEDAGYTVVP